jgi:threonine dehydrogenase-like Zn-dependent dehydrogenase
MNGRAFLYAGVEQPFMGHEMTGRVARLGARVATGSAGAPLREGDRIVYSYFFPCRRCDTALICAPDLVGA